MLAIARALIARAIDKAEDLGVRGAIAVVGASGVRRWPPSCATAAR